jgi:GNAT superfamily N-acetyltransferase
LHNILILDRLEILPQFRGRGLGLAVMSDLIKRFSLGAGLVAIKPYPLQFEFHSSDTESRTWRQELGLSGLCADEKLATQKLCDYYGRIGFRRLRGTPFMIRAASWLQLSSDDA